MIIATIAVATALAQAIHSNRSLNFFELRVDELPKLQLDKREVIEAPLTSPVELQSMALTGLLASYPVPSSEESLQTISSSAAEPITADGSNAGRVVSAR